ncbi:hypothetical protein H5V45_12995 [Nocardioides sp. KIGAM211]|uniref:AbiEi antitoxin C-terminal domain-containing protein n=1 Tax=Nocardioides luti TaxID=2761101 RepID=A0A7X0RJK3_9ACTN|nr:hypothetical protein [Nocardioides luti]MBB6628238.1 hypothetical protein [Nocardioides luti]
MDRNWDPVAAPVTGLVRPVPLDPAGSVGPTRGQARGAGWRRTTTGLYVPVDVSDAQVEQRILEQSMRLGAEPGAGAVTGWAALRLHGGGFFDGLDRDGRTCLPVPLLAVGDRFRAHPAIAVSREPLAGDDVVLRHGVRCVSVERALFDEMRRGRDQRDAVVALDMACAAGLTSIARMRAYVARRGGWRGVAQVRWALDHGDEHSRSPQETRLRLIWVLDAGWPPPLCNRTLLSLTGVELGTPDLLDVDRAVVGEYDGADHRDGVRHRRDVGREDGFRRAGLEYVEVVGADLHDAALVVARMEEAARRAARAGSAGLPRRWRLGPARESLDARLDRQDLRQAIAADLAADTAAGGVTP